MATQQEKLDALILKEKELEQKLSLIRKIRTSLELTIPVVQKVLVSGSEITNDAVYENRTSKRLDSNTMKEISDERILEIQTSLEPRIASILTLG